MIANLIGGFVTILVGVSLIGPVAQQINVIAAPGQALANSSSWSASVLLMVPGFFALSILGVGIAVTYSALRESGIV